MGYTAPGARGPVILARRVSWILHSAPDKGAEYCDVRVCLCVCLSAIISSEPLVLSSPSFVLVAYGRGSVLFWRRSDMLCTSGFMDDVIFAHKPRLLDVAAQLKLGAHAVLGLAINCAQEYQLQANGRTGLLF